MHAPVGVCHDGVMTVVDIYLTAVAMTKRHYLDKTTKYKTGPCSEDIWESRGEKLPLGEPFSMRPEQEDEA
jgi:hypothetical protein